MSTTSCRLGTSLQSYYFPPQTDLVTSRVTLTLCTDAKVVLSQPSPHITITAESGTILYSHSQTKHDIYQ